LTRSTDNQQLKGRFASAADGFTFTLDGATDPGLKFARR
jgi:hypothetical protein